VFQRKHVPVVLLSSVLQRLLEHAATTFSHPKMNAKLLEYGDSKDDDSLLSVCFTTPSERSSHTCALNLTRRS